ncbi:predicted protein [Nematostella vectensis]|uniref:CBM21 domain-containing protein n=1 Tax=Nematostella vectensis TaxID=45351 RepID=A7S412_NEMVE|nr:predicted protein [Nematostella vectensis]|eukprot:XP_001633691.1 predicted protein [Nematostella vectensis]
MSFAFSEFWLDSNANLVMKDQAEGEENGEKSPTSPNSLARRKVQFAENLVSIKMITPHSSEENMSMIKLDRQNVLKCDFEQPSSREDFKSRLKKQKVCLENVAFSGYALTGTILVENIEFCKDVTVRYSMDEWRTFTDVWADYVNQLAGGTLDRFQFRISITQNIEVGSKLEFSVRFCVRSKEYWDNNYCRNYIVECKKSAPQIKGK